MAAFTPSAVAPFVFECDVAAGVAHRPLPSPDLFARLGRTVEEVVMPKSPIGTVRRLPSGAYQARITRGGAQASVGTFPTRRLAVAAIATATSPKTEQPPGVGLRLGDWAEAWWPTRTGHRPTTRRRDRQILDHEILPALGRRLIGDMTVIDVQAWVNELAARLAPASVRRCYTILAHLLGPAADAGILAAAPTSRIGLPRPQRYEARFLTAVELEHLANVIRSPWRAMVLTTAYATLRIGEAAGLRRSDVDPGAGTLRVANNLVRVGGGIIEGPPKTSSGRRTMTMPASIMGEIDEHLARCAGPTDVFCSPQGGLLRPDTWRNLVWRPTVRKAGLGPLRIHDLKVRHEAPCTGWDERTHLRPVAAGRSKLRAA